MLLLNKKFYIFNIYYLKKSKSGYYLDAKQDIRLWLALHFKYFADLFPKTLSIHKNTNEQSKDHLKALIEDEKLLKKIKKAKYFTSSFFQEIFFHIFEINKNQLDNKKRCLKKLLKQKKSFILDDIRKVPTDPNNDTSKKSTIERLVLYNYIISLENTTQSNETKFLKSLEIFIKRIINREIPKDNVLPLINEQGHLTFYYVYDTIFSSKGMVGYALKSLYDEPPILAFRGAQVKILNRNSLFSFFDNLSKKIASNGYNAGKDKIEKILSDKNFLNKKAIIIGMSLGGGHAQRTAVDFHDKIDHLITFNSIGIDEQSIKRFNKTKAKIKITIIRKKNDIADLFGDGHLGKDSKKNINKKIIYLSETNKEFNFSPSIFSLFRSLISFHSPLFINDDAKISIYENTNTLELLDNKKRDVRWEKWRLNWRL